MSVNQFRLALPPRAGVGPPPVAQTVRPGAMLHQERRRCSSSALLATRASILTTNWSGNGGQQRSLMTSGTACSTRSDASPGKKTLQLERTFSDPSIYPYDQLEWERRTAEITDDAGKVIFKQENVEVPKAWSLLATKVVVSKYF